MKFVKVLLVIMSILSSHVSVFANDHENGNSSNTWDYDGKSGSYSVFGPKDFYRSHGKPAPETVVFNSPVTSTPLYLKITNGTAQSSQTVSSATVTLNNVVVADENDFNHNSKTIYQKIELSTSNKLSVEVKGNPGSFITVSILGYDGTPPKISITSPAPGSSTESKSINVTGAIKDDTSVNVIVNGVPASISNKIFTAYDIPLSLGVNAITARATDLGGNTATATISITRNAIVPNLVGVSKTVAEAALTAAGLTIGNVLSAYSAAVSSGNIISQSPNANSVAVPGASVDIVISLGPPPIPVPDIVGKNQADALAALTASKLITGQITSAHSSTVPAGNVISQNPAANSLVPPETAVAFAVSTGPADPPIPPDPATVAPPLDRTITTTIAASTAFLYTGANPIQTGVAADTIEEQRVAVVRGIILGIDNNPLPGVTVTVLNHPEFGQTVSRSDGMFDMAVNGGGLLTINYSKRGYLNAQRQINTPWNSFAMVPDVILLQYDSRVTTINVASTDPIQVVRGTLSTDEDGSRQATLLFSQGTDAHMVLSDGTTQNLSTLNIRATEYTVGINGPKAMPAELPPASAYTYAVELSVDEAVNARATSVQFSKPVLLYVENFLNFPVGGIVPVGYYDVSKAAWIPSDNGLIIKILGVSNGLALLDTDGTGLEADTAALAALGITDPERKQLAALYTLGQSLWRVAVRHFTPWDANWGLGPPDDAIFPNQPLPDQSSARSIKDPCKRSGSIIECQNQVLGETVRITGTPYSLNYSSSRFPRDTVVIPLSGDYIPPSLKSIVLQITVAGKTINYRFGPTTNLSQVFEWDGYDAYGRKLVGQQTAIISIGYVYSGVYYNVSRFGYNGQGLISGDRSSFTVTLWEHTKIMATPPPSEVPTDMGGWSLSVHNTLDVNARKLQTGNGDRRTVDLLRQNSTVGTITTVAGSGENASAGDGGQATQASISSPASVAVSPDGNIYIQESNRIRKISRAGIITTVAGNGEIETADSATGDEGSAIDAAISNGTNFCLGPDNSIYFSDPVRRSIRRVGTDGIITSLATGLIDPYGVIATKDGSVYFSEKSGNVVRRISTDGKITTVAGTGLATTSNNILGDGYFAVAATLNLPSGIALDSQGSLYIADTGNNRIRKVKFYGPYGYISTIAGNDMPDFNIEAGFANQVNLNSPQGIATSFNDELYIADILNNRVRHVDKNGVLATIAGNGEQGYNGDSKSATSASLYSPSGLAVANDGSIYIADRGNNRIRRITFDVEQSKNYLVASEDGSEVYEFNSSGRHIRNINSLTNATLFQFEYTSTGFLSSITDGSGNTTSIERDASGTPVAIRAPFGQKTLLAVDSNGYLKTVTNPAGETLKMTSDATGLLTTFTDSQGNVSKFVYDEHGFLTRDQNASGGSLSLTNIQAINSFYNYYRSQVEITTSLGRTTTYLTETQSGTQQKRTIISPAGANSVENLYTHEYSTYPFAIEKLLDDKTSINIVNIQDPRFSGQALLKSYQETSPSGNRLQIIKEQNTVLSDSRNILSLIAQTDKTIINNAIFTSTYDANSKTFTSTTAAGRTSSKQIDGLGRVVSYFPDVALTPVSLSYNSLGQLTQTAYGDQQTFIAYDTSGRVAGMADGLGNQSYYTYDLADRLTLLTLPSGRTFGFSYDANGNRTKITMPNGAIHNLGYTTINLGSDYTPPGNLPYSWQYNLDKEWIKTVLPGGRSVSAAYDNGGRSLGIIYPEASVSLFYGDATDRVTQITRTPVGSDNVTPTNMTYTYDGKLVTGLSFAGVSNASYSYLYDNNYLVSQIGFTSDSDTLLTSITRDKDGLTTGYGPFTFTRYGAAGAISRINDSASFETTIATMLPPRNAPTLYANVDERYVPHRAIGEKRNPRKISLLSTLARNTIQTDLYKKIEFQDSTAISHKSHSPKAIQPLFAMNILRGTDFFRRVVVPTVPNIVGLAQQDAEAMILSSGLKVGTVSIVSSETVPSGMVIDQNPIAGTSSSVGSAVDFTVSSGSGSTVLVPSIVGMAQSDAQTAIIAAHLTVGTVTLINSALPSGTVLSQSPTALAAALSGSPIDLTISGGIALDIQISRDTMGRLSNRTYTLSGTNVYSLQLSYDRRGFISRKVETVAGVTTGYDYSYDADGQLSTVAVNGIEVEKYTYDANGNRTGYQQNSQLQLSGFDSLDRIEYAGSVRYTFNADGQLVQRGDDTYQYSTQGELLQATVSGQIIYYSYDGMHRLIGRSDGTGTYQYFYGNLGSPFQLTAMRDPSGILAHYYYDDSNMLFAFDKGGVRYYVAADQLGTPKVISNASGTIVKTLDYDSFGITMVDTNPDFFIPVGFAGGITDASTGLVRFGYRDYDSFAGRWTAKDPIFFAGGQGNLYQYVQNNPINWKDPSGLISNSLPSLPGLTDRFPESRTAAISDVILGGVEVGGAVVVGIASVVSYLAGPEFWPISVAGTGASIEAGWDGVNRINSGVSKLDDLRDTKKKSFCDKSKVSEFDKYYFKIR
jgi:RHS repeat-associated protein